VTMDPRSSGDVCVQHPVHRLGHRHSRAVTGLRPSPRAAQGGTAQADLRARRTAIALGFTSVSSLGVSAASYCAWRPRPTRPRPRFLSLICASRRSSSTGGNRTPIVSASRGPVRHWPGVHYLARHADGTTGLQSCFDRHVTRANTPGPWTTRRRRAGPFWRRSTSARAWLCRSCGTARTPSQWRSTPEVRSAPPVPRSGSSRGGSACAHGRCCTLLLHRGSKRSVGCSNPAYKLRAPLRNRTVDLLLTMETLCRLS
jgi:hypothetical protein